MKCGEHFNNNYFMDLVAMFVSLIKLEFGTAYVIFVCNRNKH